MGQEEEEAVDEVASKETDSTENEKEARRSTHGPMKQQKMQRKKIQVSTAEDFAL